MNMWIRAVLILLGASLSAPALAQETEAPAAEEPAPEESPAAEPSSPESEPVVPDEAGIAGPAPLPEPGAALSESTEAATPEASASEATAPGREVTGAPAAEGSPAPETLATIPVEAAAEPAPEPLPGESDAATFDDIVVTATKRKQSVRTIPVSITALQGEKLEKIGAHELKDFIALVPGINSQDEIAGVQKKLAIRGVGPDTGSNQTVGIVFGDVPLSDPYGALSIADPDPFDLATVEVLKGPQGTLFGATSLAGVIRYVPNLPELATWSGRISADWVKVTDGGTEPAFGLVANAPLGDTAALRFAGSWQHKPGLIDMDNPSYQGTDVDDVYSRTGRVMGLWQPTDRLGFNLWHLRGQRQADELSYTTNLSGEYGSNGDFRRDDAPGPSPVRNSYSLTNLDIRYEFDWATLVSVSGYQQKESYNDADASYLVRQIAELGIRSVRTTRDVATQGFLQELRAVSPDDGGKWSWIIGGFYSTYEADVLAKLFVYPGTATIAQILDRLPPALTAGLYEEGFGVLATTTGFDPIEASEKALFGEISRTLFDTFTLTLGGRWYSAGVSGTRRTTGASTEPGDAAIESIGKGFSPKFSLAWRPSNDLMLYGTVSRGFQYGGFNVPLTLPTPPTFESSTLWNYEIGARTDWFDRTLRFDITALYLDWTNPQVNQATNPPIQGYVDNVGAARSYGVETTLRWFTPLEGLTLETSAARITAETTVPYTDASGNVIPEGTLMPSSPELQVTSSASYVLGLGDWLTTTTLMHTYQGEAWNNISHHVQVGDYQLFNLSFGVTRTDLPFTPGLQFSVNNLADERALLSALGGSEGPADTTPRPVVYTLPRTFRLNLTASF